MMLGKKSKIFKIALFQNLFLLLVGVGVVAYYIFFRQIEIKIEQIEWVEEFAITIPELRIDEPCFLVATTTVQNAEGKVEIEKQDIKIGVCTNSKILVPLRIKSDIKKYPDLFFVPRFRAEIEGGERTKEEDLRLRANFSLHLLTNNCPQDTERIQIQNSDFVLCDIEVSSSNVMSFSITERRKNLLAEKIIEKTDRNDYVFVIKVAPCLKKVRNLSSFSIRIENIAPELIIP